MTSQTRSSSRRITLAAAMVLALLPCGRGFEATASASAAPTAQRHPNGYRFWIGEVGPSDGPLHLGPKQVPFICHTYESGLGQPLVDNQDGRGHPVFPESSGEPDFSASPVGYSERCGIATRVDYFYWDASAQDFRRFDPGAMFDAPPSTIQWIVVNGRQVPFVVRVETGTLDRFLYTIAMLAPWRESTARLDGLDNRAWNRKLIYYFRGGVGIGHQQGRASWLGGLWRAERAVFPQLLSQGYAIATSSGNQTGIQYNLRLAEEVTLMVKRHFVAAYGEPAYTVGLGESGGGVQQYTIAQNHPGLLDAGIPMYSYPDMVTQAIYAGDCNLLEQYFLEDVQAKGASSKWAVWSRRQWIEGLNASDAVTNSVFRTKGSSECIEGWFFAEPLVLNPRFTDPWYLESLERYRYPADAVAAIRWTHFNDLQNIYGVDAEGFAPILFDNVGVQYGLAALRDGKITPAEFVEINSCAGSWKAQRDYVQWDPYGDPFDARNMQRDPAACRLPAGAGWAPNPRQAGDLGAMHAAYRSGHVFTGHADIPLIDLRPYLEPKLNMHNVRQSFSARLRMQRKGHGRNQVIWFTGSEADVPARVGDALAILDAWLTTGRRPAGFVDQCTDASGNLIAAGRRVWDGVIDQRAPGACTAAYPVRASSRIVAGDSLAGDMFKCALRPLASALADGTYGAVSFTAAEVAQLERIFPNGVCDYTQPDQGKPAGRHRPRAHEADDEDGPERPGRGRE